MLATPRPVPGIRVLAPTLLALTALIAAPLVALAVTVVQLSSDPFTNATSQHRTQVEPDSFSYGSTIVAAFQSGRFFDGGSSDIGWATSADGAATGHNGFLPGITKFQGGGPYDRVSDPSVAYDPKHNAWLISSLAIRETASGQADPNNPRDIRDRLRCRSVPELCE